MPQQPFRTALVLALLLLFTAPARMIAGPKKPDAAPGEETARDALVKFNKEWKEYTNEPNLGDPRWKLKMEVLVRLAQAGPAAFPLLEEAAKRDSKWSASTRQFATDFLPILHDAKSRKAVADYDLSQIESARVGKPAPDFELKDAAGKTHRLSQFRDKTVVLAFIVFDL